jgi:peptidoglycan/LPS O-acetylase OafA/YrhL
MDGISHHRIGWLDGWRAIAVGLVILSHLGGLYHWPIEIPGKLGVFIFFAISGYIVTKILIGERRATDRIDVFAFYRRRAARILPPLIIYLLTCLALGLTSWTYVARSVSFTCNIGLNWGGGCGWLYGHTWSLAFEEQYYLLVPFLLIARLRWIAVLLAPIVLLPLVFPLIFIGKIGFLQIYMLLGLRLIQSQNAMAVASATPERKLAASLS